MLTGVGNRGQYSDAVLNELESQNDQQVEGILGKVKLLKDVRSPSPLPRPFPSGAIPLPLDLLLYQTLTGVLRLQMTVAIGDEIRDSSALAEKMNDGFDQTRLRLGRTMNRMMIMAERTGVGWRLWLGFFVAVIFLFMYVWLF